MCFKRNIVLFLQREILLLKSIKILFWVPIVLVNFLLPAFAYYESKTVDPSSTEYFTETAITIIIPLFSAWWSTFILKEFLESSGNEVLWIGRKTVFAEILFPYIIYVLDFVVVLICISLWLNTLTEIIKMMVIVSVFMFGFSYFTAFMSKNVTVSLLFSVAYVLVNQVIVTGEQQPFLYTSALNCKLEEAYIVYMPVAFSGVLLTIAGYVANCLFKGYK